MLAAELDRAGVAGVAVIETAQTTEVTRNFVQGFGQRRIGRGSIGVNRGLDGCFIIAATSFVDGSAVAIALGTRPVEAGGTKTHAAGLVDQVFSCGPGDLHACFVGYGAACQVGVVVVGSEQVIQIVSRIARITAAFGVRQAQTFYRAGGIFALFPATGATAPAQVTQAVIARCRTVVVAGVTPVGIGHSIVIAVRPDNVIHTARGIDQQHDVRVHGSTNKQGCIGDADGADRGAGRQSNNETGRYPMQFECRFHNSYLERIQACVKCFGSALECRLQNGDGLIGATHSACSDPIYSGFRQRIVGRDAALGIRYWWQFLDDVLGLPAQVGQ